MERTIQYLPHWLVWPVNLLSIVSALTGAGLVFYGAGFGDGSLAAFVWGGIAFVIAALLWWVADLASSHPPAEYT
jgi:hypothetical protein